jgi:hypothetical protein
MSNKEQRVILRERVNIFFVKNFFVKDYFAITCKRLINFVNNLSSYTQSLHNYIQE